VGVGGGVGGRRMSLGGKVIKGALTRLPVREQFSLKEEGPNVAPDDTLLPHEGKQNANVLLHLSE